MHKVFGMFPIEIICTFTDSPSWNVRILSNGNSIFYNSQRLSGDERTQKVGKILGLKVLRVGLLQMTITRKQFDAICAVETGRKAGDVLSVL